MFQRISAFVLVAIAFVSLAIASDARAERADFQETGRVDAVQLEENVIVIDDIRYRLSDSLVVYSRQSSNASRKRIRAGIKVGFKQVNGEVVTHLWLLPESYDIRRRRR